MHTVPYFGFGTNAHPSMIEAIIGRAPEGRPAFISGFEMIVQALRDVPDTALLSAPLPISPRKILRRNWDDRFACYGIRRHEERMVRGVLWSISPEEREILSSWELIPFGWSSNIFVDVILSDGTTRPAQTEWIYDQPIERVVDGRKYPYFIAPEEDMFRVARHARREYYAAALEHGLPR
ncbi:MAG: gamma-glutamylcyclotransferase family protein [Minisyncoccia bacterium]